MTISSRYGQLGRIEQVLRHIHLNLDKPLAVASLARIGGWSRWQFNRVFSEQTGQSVGRYVRELRLSMAAEMLLFTEQRIIDIGLACGFSSDISFTRSFKQHFGCPPAQYRRRGLPCLLTTPLCLDPAMLPDAALRARVPAIRLDSKPAFGVSGRSDRIRGLFSSCPDFGTKVPALWASLIESERLPAEQPRFGVLDLSRGPECEFRYLAGVQTENQDADTGSETLKVPAQNYVVISFQGPIQSLSEILKWFFTAWLPHAGCNAVYGYDLEVYPPDFDAGAPEVAMEYWIPVTLNEPFIARHAPIG
uniref:AraC family transcriptional regulator n=1 Tax=Marinobacter nauticus TaxID=2743 RepID=A0A455VZE6_MARNT|nr:AraC family transcriptional regulator [Marinobacter nauticus]